MKKIISFARTHIIPLLIACAFSWGFMAGGIATDKVFSKVEGITAENYLDYEKPNKDVYGFNKGECSRDYIQGEEEYYNEYIDHWNVDKVIDEQEQPEQEQPEQANVKTHYAETDPLKDWAKSKGYASIDEKDIIDSYPQGEWYAYYIYCDGDNWVITTKHGKVDKAYQLN